jgi:outer membrane protein assembly factor BamB
VGRWWHAGVVALLACGARTAVLPGGGGGASSSGGGAGATPLAVKCTAALADGAPTPMKGYCPTRANQAAMNGPRAPKVAWSVTPFAIKDPESFLPAESVVDGAGRAYVVIDASPLNPTHSPNQLFAVDPDGTVAWTSSFDGTASALALGRDGKLWVLEQPQTDAGAGATVLMGFSRDGGPPVNVPVPGAMSPFGAYPQYVDMVLGSDGSFFLESQLQDAFARVAPDGMLVWQWPPSNLDPYGQAQPPLLLGPDDGVVGAGDGVVLRLDSAGVEVWQQTSGVQNAAIDAQGNVVALESSITGDALSLVTIDAIGDTARTVSLPTMTINASRLALAGDGTAVVLLVDEGTSPGLTKAHLVLVAVDASGKTRWTTPLDATLEYDPATLATHYGLFVDGSGTVVVTAGAITGLDLVSGSVEWTIQAPSSTSCVRPAVLGAGGSILATQCDGTVFLARDP